jgi:hypothetical protein
MVRIAPTARFVCCVDKAENHENERIRLAKRNESFGGGSRKSLRSLRGLNQRFRGIVCFQWVDPRFVSPFSPPGLFRFKNPTRIAHDRRASVKFGGAGARSFRGYRL